jgi:hypothetical protein
MPTILASVIGDAIFLAGRTGVLYVNAVFHMPQSTSFSVNSVIDVPHPTIGAATSVPQIAASMTLATIEAITTVGRQ